MFAASLMNERQTRRSAVGGRGDAAVIENTEFSVHPRNGPPPIYNCRAKTGACNRCPTCKIHLHGPNANDHQNAHFEVENKQFRCAVCGIYAQKSSGRKTHEEGQHGFIRHATDEKIKGFQLAELFNVGTKLVEVQKKAELSYDPQAGEFATDDELQAIIDVDPQGDGCPNPEKNEVRKTDLQKLDEQQLPEEAAERLGADEAAHAEVQVEGSKGMEMDEARADPLLAAQLGDLAAQPEAAHALQSTFADTRATHENVLSDFPQMSARPLEAVVDDLRQLIPLCSDPQNTPFARDRSELAVLPEMDDRLNHQEATASLDTRKREIRPPEDEGMDVSEPLEAVHDTITAPIPPLQQQEAEQVAVPHAEISDDLNEIQSEQPTAFKGVEETDEIFEPEGENEQPAALFRSEAPQRQEIANMLPNERPSGQRVPIRFVRPVDTTKSLEEIIASSIKPAKPRRQYQHLRQTTDEKPASPAASSLDLPGSASRGLVSPVAPAPAVVVQVEEPAAVPAPPPTPAADQ
ncbi:hypothetical protein M3Y99_01987400 [Aphelenchoides fujianensis]|nr:hypothetical protein M3Y99_01987400 [Aphelenchoides fujianensis]